jgi:hypothetical protein
VALVERRIRVARGVAASSAATLIALAGHVVAGGAVPSPLLVAIPLVLSWLPGVALIGRRPRLWRQAAVILPAQAALHAVFAATGTAVAPMTDPDAMPGMGAPPVALPWHSGVHEPSAMWLGHALAALLTVLAWQRGERAFWTLVRLAREAVAAVLLPRAVAPAPVDAPRLRPDGARVLPRPARRAGRRHPRRGPPAGAVSA